MFISDWLQGVGSFHLQIINPLGDKEKLKGQRWPYHGWTGNQSTASLGFELHGIHEEEETVLSESSQNTRRGILEIKKVGNVLTVAVLQMQRI